MAKRRVVGSVYKAKANEDGSPKKNSTPYIKIRETVTLHEGDIIRLESKKSQLESLEAAVKANKVQADYAEQVKERINKMPDYVLFELVQFLDKQ